MAALAVAFSLAAVAAHACDTRPVAQQAAAFDSCGTPWTFVLANADEDVYLCDQGDCPPNTVLRFNVSAMDEDDRALDREELLDEWTGRQVPETMGSFAIEMLEPIGIETIAGTEGIVIPLRLTDNDDDSQFVSVAFRIVRETDYVIANVTGEADLPEVRALLDQVVAQLSLPEDPQP